MVLWLRLRCLLGLLPAPVHVARAPDLRSRERGDLLQGETGRGRGRRGGRGRCLNPPSKVGLKRRENFQVLTTPYEVAHSKKLWKTKILKFTRIRTTSAFRLEENLMQL